jgi:biotin operon repressor
MNKGIDDLLASGGQPKVLSGKDAVLAEIDAIIIQADAWRLHEIASQLLKDPAVLHKAIRAIEDHGVVGERQNIGMIRLQARSRALPRPTNIEVNSPSSAGKTQAVLGTLAFEDPSAFYELTASSEKALIYLEESLANRILYIQEPEGLAQGVGFAVIKSIIWEGRLKYDTVIKENGKFIGKHIEKDGPTGLIVTSTIGLEVQLTNRLLRLEVDTSNEQTRRILKSIAAHFNGSRNIIDLTPWHALSKVLGSPTDVEVPFAVYLAENISDSALRIRRDFTQLLTLIQASAVEYKYQRKQSSTGRTIATMADYAHVYNLADAAFQAAQEDGITEADRKMVSVVERLTTPIGGKPGEEPVSQAKIAEKTKMSKGQISYRVKRLITAGYLANQETAKGKPHKLVPGAALPDKVPPLPTPGQLSEWLIQNNMADLIIPWVNPISGAIHNCANYLFTTRKISVSSSQNRTPDPCLDCPQNEANIQVKAVGSDTNRTSEHPENVKLKSSGSSGEAELPPTSPLAEPTNVGSSAVRFNDGDGIVKNGEKKNPTQMPYEEVID